MAAIGKLFALASVAFGGIATGIFVERSTGKPAAAVPPSIPRHPTPQVSSPSKGGRPNPTPTAPQSSDDDAAIYRFGLPSDGNLRAMRGYVASLNYERRIPNWVLERIVYTKRGKNDASNSDSGSDDSDGSAAKVDRVKSCFHADPLTPDAFRVAPNDYSDVRGMSRGHLAPAQFHKGSQEEMNETFNMNANIVPQDMTVNAVDWLRVEGMVRKLSKEFENGLWVVTGPVFMPTYNVTDPEWRGKRVVQYELIGKKDVAVPTHLFKVVLGEEKDGSRSVAAFILPNAPIPEEQPLTQYQVAPSYVEQLCGLQLFPSLPDRGGVAGLPNMCKKHRCEGRSSALFRAQRYVGQLRLAKTLPELNSTLQRLSKDNQVDEVVRKEYEARVKELSAQRR